MATILASNFTSNALSGSIRTADGYANVILTSIPYALEGDKSFVIKIRRDSVDGPVVATTNPITLQDNSTLVSVTANTSIVGEGNLVSFTVVTANAANNANLFYSILPITANVTADDFVANTGSFTIVNNIGTVVLKANADVSLVDEAGETFKLQVRTLSPVGNIVYTASNVEIVDNYKTVNIISLTPAFESSIESSNITFTFVATNVPAGTVFYYETTGNATVTANTGSFVLNGISNTFTISAGAVPANETRAFKVNLRTGSAAGPIVGTSNDAYVVDSALAYMYATGGNDVYNHNGYRVHKFYAANTLTVVNAGVGSTATVEYMVVGGGGGGGGVIQSPPYSGGGGGAGGVAYGNISLNGQPVAVVIGSGGAPGTFTANPGSNSYITSPAISGQIIGLGGGAGGWAGPGTPGGSGGGGAQYSSPTTAGSSIPFTVTGGTHYGNPGGTGSPSFSGGGGGAGTAGSTGGAGSGLSTTITGASTAWGAGGPAGTGPAGASNTGNGGGGGPQPSGAPGGGSGIVVLRYRYIPPAQYVSVTPTKARVAQGSNVVFTLSTLDLSNNTLLYYTTVGNVISSDFVSGNTGSFRTTSNSTVITLPTNSNIPIGQTRYFQLQIREESLTSNIRLTSSNVTLLDVADPTVANVRYLVVAGGGSGATPSAPGSYGGGGGGGGFLEGTLPVITNFTYVMTVGGGGSNANGSNSRISGHASNVIALGGGFGGDTYSAGNPGGSGGGGGINGGLPGQSRSGGNGTPGQGYAGGSAGPGIPGSNGGGGGGAGGPGESAPGPSFGGGHGGIGKYSDITGTSLGYSGGGGGSGNNSPNIGTGGAYNNPNYPTMNSPAFGAGGAYGFAGFFHGSNGSFNSANVNQGGGGATSAPGGGSGGSGIVVVSHPVAYAEAATTGSPNVIYANANIIYRFWQSGTITF